MLSPRAQLFQLAFGHIVARAVHIAAELGIADALEQGALSLADLVKCLAVNQKAFYRLMRVLVSHGVFSYTTDQKFALNDVSQLLLTDHPESIRYAMAKEMDARRWHCVGQLEQSIRRGEPAFSTIYGETFYDYLSHDMAAKNRFDAGMSIFSRQEDKEIASTYDFSSVKHLVDVGGGQGSLSAEILKRFPSLHVTLFDLPETVEDPAFLRNSPELKGRYNTAGGNFFESVPAGGDLYLLKRVIHNWPDTEAVAILKNCAQHLSPQGRILIIDLVEAPLTPETQATPLIDADLGIGLAICGGIERTPDEFDAILDQAGLERCSIIPLAVSVKIVEAKRKEL